MWERIRRELLIEYYWWKRHATKKRRLDSPLGVMGILPITLGIVLMIIIGQAFAAFFRNMIPLVSGTQLAGAYWSSIFFALKASLVFIFLIVFMIVILFLKLTQRKR